MSGFSNTPQRRALLRSPQLGHQPAPPPPPLAPGGGLAHLLPHARNQPSSFAPAYRSFRNNLALSLSLALSSLYSPIVLPFCQRRSGCFILSQSPTPPPPPPTRRLAAPQMTNLVSLVLGSLFPQPPPPCPAPLHRAVQTTAYTTQHPHTHMLPSPQSSRQRPPPHCSHYYSTLTPPPSTVASTPLNTTQSSKLYTAPSSQRHCCC